MVRGDLGGDLDAGLLGEGDRLYRGAAGEVLDVDLRVLVAGERGVARDHRRLGDGWDPAEAERRRDRALVHDAIAGQIRVLLVKGDRKADEALVLERLAKHAGAAHGQSVVGEADGAGVAQLDLIAQLLARASPA